MSETQDPNYTAVIGGDCAADGSITLAATDVKTCTITNTFKAPKLTVTKIVDNTGGGTKQLGDFPLFVDGNPVTNGVQITTSSVGTHTVSETAGPQLHRRHRRRLRRQRLHHAGGGRRQDLHHHQHVQGPEAHRAARS